MSAMNRPGNARAVFGLGPLERWLADPAVTEVMVNAGAEVWIERAGRPPELVDRLEPGVLDAVVERILSPIGRRLDRTSPVVDARLPDGSRVCAVVPPVAVDGTCLAVRRFGIVTVPISAFAAGEVVQLLRHVVASRCHVLVSGLTSSGKTTLLNALAGEVPPGERIITLEDTAELRLAAEHVLRLEARPPSPDGAPLLDLATLLRAALRLRPDRLVVGEIRGSEAPELVQALNTGHDGSLATVHANSPLDALARIESLVVQASPAWSLAAVRAQVRRCVDVVVHVTRHSDGSRGIAAVAEVEDRSGDRLDVRLLANHDGVVASLSRGRR